MELFVYDDGLNLLGVIDDAVSLIWTRRYWQCGDFKLLAPFTDGNAALLRKYRLLARRGDDEAGEIRYVNIKKNAQGHDEIEAQGMFVTRWIGKRVIHGGIVTTAFPQDILRLIVSSNLVSPPDHSLMIPDIYIAPDPGIVREPVFF